MVTANTRASDDDRNDTCQVLDSAFAEGQLSMEEHRQRVSAATKAATLGDLDSLVADLQIRNLPDQRPTPKSPARMWGVVVAGAAVLVLATAGINWARHSDTSSPNSTATPNGDTAVASSTAPSTSSAPSSQAQPDLLTVGGLTGFLAQMRVQFGDAMGYQLNVRSESAEFYRPNPASAQNMESWDYHSGNWTKKLDVPVPYETTSGDLSAFDLPAVLGVLQGAAGTLHITNATNTQLTVESQKDASLVLRIVVNEGNRTGRIELAANGAVKRIVMPES